MLPYIQHDGRSHKLFVDGKPYLALGGEIRNSSSSNLSYMEQKVWPHIRELNLNTVIAPVYWELIEPVEGTFSFELVEGLIRQARREQVRLVLLWFGLWKNGMSTYAPAWVKTDSARYFRVRDAFGRPINAISPLCDAAVERDGDALAALMAFLKEFDTEHTVIMIQVENEVGILGSERDFSEQANAGFTQEVPAVISEIYNTGGTWEAALCDQAPELFMAYHYACAVEKIAKKATAVYPLPLYVNAWLDQFPQRPGRFPTGGPVARVMRIWQKAAPSLALLAPDIYASKFLEIYEAFTAADNPLFIPEARCSADSAYNVFAAVGNYDAICFAPFAIEDLHRDENAAALLAGSYGLLGNMSELILSAQGSDREIKGFSQYDVGGEELFFDNYDIYIHYTKNAGCTPTGGGIVIQTGPDEFVMAGMNFRAEFLPKKGERALVDYLYIEEGVFRDNQWLPARRLNGDEYHVRCGTGAYVLKVGVYRYS
ncbi:MAG: DUF5597 domain-containing protein [Oscillospiraceae bacterium]|nr:DUF5597 domain-containing protein [Oscillospiraceae bacterium]